MSTSLTQSRIETAKRNLETARSNKATAEAQLKVAESEKENVINSMAELGVTPDTIDAKIEELKTSIDSDLATIEQLMPEVH